MSKIAVAAKVDPDIHALIVRTARERAVTVSSLIAEVLESAFREGEGNRKGRLPGRQRQKCRPSVSSSESDKGG